MLALFAVALFAFATTEFVKTIIPWTLQAWTKIAVAGVVVAVWAVVSGSSFEVSGGAFGLALIVHRTHRLLGSIGDAYRVQVLSATGRRPR